GVELEHLIMTWNRDSCQDFASQRSRLAAIHVAGYSAGRVATIDGKQGHNNSLARQPFGHSVIADCIAPVIDRPRTAVNDVAEAWQLPVLVALNRLRCGWNGRQRKARRIDCLFLAKTDKAFRRHA